jgi:DNA-binding transcriptional LysR family regulator
LFERFRDGYAPTPAGETAAESAARLEDEVRIPIDVAHHSGMMSPAIPR